MYVAAGPQFQFSAACRSEGWHIQKKAKSL